MEDYNAEVSAARKDVLDVARAKIHRRQAVATRQALVAHGRNKGRIRKEPCQRGSTVDGVPVTAIAYRSSVYQATPLTFSQPGNAQPVCGNPQEAWSMRITPLTKGPDHE